MDDETAKQKLYEAKFGWLVGRAYPNAPLEELLIISDWITWMFILDDLSEEMSKESDKLAAMYAKFLNILRGTQAKEVEDIPLGHGLQDIRQR